MFLLEMAGVDEGYDFRIEITAPQILGVGNWRFASLPRPRVRRILYGDHPLRLCSGIGRRCKIPVSGRSLTAKEITMIFAPFIDGVMYY